MADFMETLKAKAKEMASAFGEKTGTLVEAAKEKANDTTGGVKIDMAIRKAKTALSQEYEMLGQLVYNVKKGILNDDPEILEASVKRIEDCRNELAELTGQKETRQEEKKAAREKESEAMKENAKQVTELLKGKAAAAAAGAKKFYEETREKVEDKIAEVKEKKAAEEEIEAEKPEFEAQAEEEAQKAVEALAEEAEEIAEEAVEEAAEAAEEIAEAAEEADKE